VAIRGIGLTPIQAEPLTQEFARRGVPPQVDVQLESRVFIEAWIVPSLRNRRGAR